MPRQSSNLVTTSNYSNNSAKHTSAAGSQALVGVLGPSTFIIETMNPVPLCLSYYSFNRPISFPYILVHQASENIHLCIMWMEPVLIISIITSFCLSTICFFLSIYTLIAYLNITTPQLPVFMHALPLVCVFQHRCISSLAHSLSSAL